jgi:predicted peptidase
MSRLAEAHRGSPLANARAGVVLLFLMSLFLVSPASTPAATQRVMEGQHAQLAIAPGNYPYQLFVPRGYLDSGERRWPLLIFLHGSGERGDDIAKIKVHGPPKIADKRRDFPFVTVSPLLPADEDWDIAKLDALLDHVTAQLRIDRSRIYLTGLSRGGHTAWRWGAAEPGRFAAIVPVSGRGDPSQACKLKDTPLWAFHGDRDDIVTPFGSFAMVEAVRSCGGKPRLTIYPDTGHDAWTRTYGDPALYAWMLEHSTTASPPPDK